MNEKKCGSVYFAHSENCQDFSATQVLLVFKSEINLVIKNGQNLSFLRILEAVNFTYDKFL